MTTTTTRQITLPEWEHALADISHRYQGALATIECIGPRIGDQLDAVEQPFHGISFDRSGMSIHVGRNDGAHLTNRISSPRRLWVVTGAGDAVEALEIESEDGLKTLVRFRLAPVREGLDPAVQEPALHSQAKRVERR